MTTNLPPLPSSRSPQQTITLASSAPAYLTSPLSTTDTIQTWLFHETLFISTLRTGDHRTARLCLQRISDRFGATDDRVLGLVGLLDEACAEGTRGLEGVLRGYEEILKEDATILTIAKRRVAVLKSLDRLPEAIVAIRELLEISPTDAETWGEASGLYFEAGLFEQAIFCLEEVVLQVPSAYNIFARLGEVSFVAAKAAGNGLIAGGEVEEARRVFDSTRYYCRALELCDTYLRAFYGLFVTGRRALELLSNAELMRKISSTVGKKDGKDTKQQEIYVPKKEVVEQLVEMCISKLGEIIRNWRSGKDGWTGYDEAEIVAAEELLKALEAEKVR